MRFLSRRRLPRTVSFDEATGRICDRTCRADAAIERARIAALMAR
ncbi:hypothetical protein [Nonomuraea sp. 3-1Str]|nr:hypothetical protein [Nonomuraea sp. 3-1Str]